MDFFDSQHPFFPNQTLNRQRFPTINRSRAQAPAHEEWFRRGGGSISPSQIRRSNQEQQQLGEQRRFGSQRAPDSPGQSRRIPIMVADGQGGFRALGKDRNLVQERNQSPPSQQGGTRFAERQSSYDRAHPAGAAPQHPDRHIFREGPSSPPRDHKGISSPSAGSKPPKTFNIPIQIEGQGRECFVKDELPSEDEGYSQEDCSSQTEDESRNIAEPPPPPPPPVIIQDKYQDVRNMPRFVSEAHFPTFRREEGERRGPPGGIQCVVDNDVPEKVNRRQDGERADGEAAPSSEDSDYPFPEVTVPAERRREAAPHPRDAESGDDGAPAGKEEGATSESEREPGSGKGSSDSDGQSTPPRATPLERIAKIAAGITRLGGDVARVAPGRGRTKEHRRVEEYLMRALLELDDIDTQGDATVRTERKRAVQRAQNFLGELENKSKT